MREAGTPQALTERLREVDLLIQEKLKPKGLGALAAQRDASIAPEGWNVTEFKHLLARETASEVESYARELLERVACLRTLLSTAAESDRPLLLELERGLLQEARMYFDVDRSRPGAAPNLIFSSFYDPRKAFDKIRTAKKNSTVLGARTPEEVSLEILRSFLVFDFRKEMNKLFPEILPVEKDSLLRLKDQPTAFKGQMEAVWLNANGGKNEFEALWADYTARLDSSVDNLCSRVVSPAHAPIASVANVDTLGFASNPVELLRKVTALKIETETVLDAAPRNSTPIEEGSAVILETVRRLIPEIAIPLASMLGCSPERLRPEVEEKSAPNYIVYTNATGETLYVGDALQIHAWARAMGSLESILRMSVGHELLHVAHFDRMVDLSEEGRDRMFFLGSLMGREGGGTALETYFAKDPNDTLLFLWRFLCQEELYLTWKITGEPIEKEVIREAFKKRGLEMPEATLDAIVSSATLRTGAPYLYGFLYIVMLADDFFDGDIRKTVEFLAKHNILSANSKLFIRTNPENWTWHHPSLPRAALENQD